MSERVPTPAQAYEMGAARMRTLSFIALEAKLGREFWTQGVRDMLYQIPTPALRDHGVCGYTATEETQVSKTMERDDA